MRIAAIDLGTNTCLLLVAEMDESGRMKVLREEQRIPRLGKDVDAKGRLSDVAFHRVERVLQEYKSIISTYNVDTITTCGTSALRDSSNKIEFIEHIFDKTGVRIEVLSGEDEALWTFRGALTGSTDSPYETAVLDIGGGSTEISIGIGKNNSESSIHIEKHSFQMGSVRLTERFFQVQPASEQSLGAARTFISAQLGSLTNLNISNRILIGVAGTVTALACLEQGLVDFNRERVSGYVLSINQIDKWLVQLSKLSPDEIRGLSNVTEGRHDILTAGVLILSEFMRTFQIKEIVTSERGVRYGLAVRKWEEITKR